MIVSSGLAEVFASCALCPMEVTRIYIVSNPTLMKGGMIRAMNAIIQKEGVAGLFKGLQMIMLRQVPYTCAKLVGYDFISDAIRRKIFSDSEDSHIKNSNWIIDATIPLLSGVSAGLIAATISQPADVLLSKICGVNSKALQCLIDTGPKGLISVMQELGWKGCYSGFKPRAVMVGTMTALQFLVYEQTKKTVKQWNYPSLTATNN